MLTIPGQHAPFGGLLGDVAELVDAPRSGRGSGNGVGVRVSPSPPTWRGKPMGDGTRLETGRGVLSTLAGSIPVLSAYAPTGAEHQGEVAELVDALDRKFQLQSEAQLQHSLPHQGEDSEEAYKHIAGSTPAFPAFMERQADGRRHPIANRTRCVEHPCGFDSRSLRLNITVTRSWRNW